MPAIDNWCQITICFFLQKSILLIEIIAFFHQDLMIREIHRMKINYPCTFDDCYVYQLIVFLHLI